MSQNNDSEEGELPDIPPELRAILEPDEIRNLKNLDGWSYVRVAHVEDGERDDTFEAWAEIFDGNGGANHPFTGVRVHAVSPDYMEEVPWQDQPIPFETYAYANEERFEESEHDTAYYVEEYIHGEEVEE